MHEEFMHRCLQLASRGRGLVSPNPLVGSVIVHQGRIIGEGYHAAFGGPHAERHAIESVHDKNLLAASTLYVSLEPCCHSGKTPPCTDLITKHKIPEVVIGMQDPFNKVNGQGMRLLKKQGVRVVFPVLEHECLAANRRFAVFHDGQRPYVILKWAQSRDGFIAPSKQDEHTRWISNEYSLRLVHRWRAQEDAVMVGAGTALADDPMLTVRLVKGRNPVRIVTDRTLRLPPTLKLFDQKTKTIVLTEAEKKSREKLHYEKTSFRDFPRQALARLHALDVQSVIVEGGARLLQSFIQSGLWDEARRFTGTTTLGEGLRAPLITGSHQGSENIDGDMLDIFFR